MRVDGGATIATLLCPPRHRSPRATEDGGGIANPGCNSYIQHGSEPPRSKLGQTWFIDHEAHLLQSRFIVNSNSSENRYSETIPKKAYVLLDNAPMHRAKAFVRHIPRWVKKGLIIKYLPPYSPELNLIEILW